MREQCELPAGKLKAIGWDEVSEKIWLPRYHALLEPHADVLGRFVPSRLGQALAKIQDFSARLRSGLAVFSPEAEKKRTLFLFGAWLALELTKHGFLLDAAPGRAVRAERDGARVQPFLVVNGLANGTLSAAEWQRRCAELGLQ